MSVSLHKASFPFRFFQDLPLLMIFCSGIRKWALKLLAKCSTTTSTETAAATAAVRFAERIKIFAVEYEPEPINGYN